MINVNKFSQRSENGSKISGKLSLFRKLIAMSLQIQPIPAIPETTLRVASKAFRQGNVYMQMRDLLGTFFTDDHFVDLYPPDGQPAYTPWRQAFLLAASSQTLVFKRVCLTLSYLAPT